MIEIIHQLYGLRPARYVKSKKNNGLLESYSLSTPYINQGAIMLSNYTYIDRGPIDVTDLIALYDEIEEAYNNMN